jgi:heme/copper-type cytochrome/quinol oxidase subunit 1
MPPAQGDCTFFSPSCGGDPTFAQHLYWLCGHPELHAGVLIGLGLIGLTILLLGLRRGAASARLLPPAVPALWLVGLVVLSAAGSVTGLMLVRAGADRALFDSFYVVAHIFFAFSMCVWFALFAAWYHWFPRLSGHTYAQAWGHLHFWATFAGASLLLVSQNALAFAQIPRRYVDLSGTFAFWSDVSTVGAYVAAIGTLFLLVSVVHGHVEEMRGEG